jgi:hypothetical protein
MNLRRLLLAFWIMPTRDLESQSCGINPPAFGLGSYALEDGRRFHVQFFNRDGVDEVTEAR